MKAYAAYQAISSSNQHQQIYTDYGNPVDTRCYTVYYFTLFVQCLLITRQRGLEMYGRYKHITLFTKIYTLPPCLTMFPVRVTLHSLIILNGVTTYAPRSIRLFYTLCIQAYKCCSPFAFTLLLCLHLATGANFIYSYHASMLKLF